jgi:hypothetical protein
MIKALALLVRKAAEGRRGNRSFICRNGMGRLTRGYAGAFGKPSTLIGRPLSSRFMRRVSTVQESCGEDLFLGLFHAPP